MHIVYAAEKPSIAGVLSDHVRTAVDEGDIEVRANPNETGSFFVRWGPERYVLLPNGQLTPSRPRR
jgi:hypothetical protein